MEYPKWTVVTNLVSKESNKWIGTSWEFFDKEDWAQNCFDRQVQNGNCPTKRPFSKKTDCQRLGAVHRIRSLALTHCQLCQNVLVPDKTDKSILRCSNDMACNARPIKLKH